MQENYAIEVSESNNFNIPMEKLNLQGNHFCGNILIGNYSYLTHLEVTENEVDVLDLSSLFQLESLKCSQNKIREIFVNGSNITFCEIKCSELKKISILPPPKLLETLDISQNNLTELPGWIFNCYQLTTLNASHNEIQTINKHHLTWNMKSLRVLHLGFNQLKSVDGILENSTQVQDIYLQCNEIEELPQNLFTYVGNHLKNLNLSCNKLTTLPKNTSNNLRNLEEIYVTSNKLDNSFFAALSNSKKLRVLHAAYNKLSVIPETILNSFLNLEELVLSGNYLQKLPKLSALIKLKVLRLHSNLLLSIPLLSNLCSLKVLDLAHNHLNKVDLQNIVPKTLQFLDLSCNTQLQVEHNQAAMFQSQRNWSLIDVSGKNRSNLPSKDVKCDVILINKSPWIIGFSETPGNLPCFFVRQIRLPLFKPNEGLFGMFESENSIKIPKMWVNVIPKIFVQKKTIKETIGEYIKYAQLSVQYKICNDGQKFGFSVALCHIAKDKFTINDQSNNLKRKKCTLCVASLGSITVFLIKKTSIVNLTLRDKDNALKSKANFVAEPLINEITLENDDEYLVICNKEVFKVMDMDRIAREIRRNDDVILASKRIQDIAQSFGASLNISTIVVKFKNIGTDVNSLINELKQTKNKKNLDEDISSYWSEDRKNLFYRQMLIKSVRSSPSLKNRKNLHKIATPSHISEDSDVPDDVDETDSMLSGEQFKCWEYMLEQNTQLLFDKELNTISKSFSKTSDFDKKLNPSYRKAGSDTQLKKATKTRLLSISSPQLICNDFSKNRTVSYQTTFFSKNSRGSGPLARPQYSNFVPNSQISGVPNSAYFGSLQCVMPDKFETDFTVSASGRPFSDENCADFDDRMGQYWAIASTEL